MLARIVASIYAALFLLFVALEPWSPTLLVDAAFLACYLALCHRHGLDAILGSDRSHPFAGSLLLVGPASLLIGSFSLAGPWVPGLLLLVLLVPLVLGISLLRRSRRARKSRGRALEGWAILVSPVAVFALFAVFVRGTAGGVMIVLLNWLEFSFRYAGSGIERLVPVTAAGVLVAFVAARFGLRRSWVGSAFLALAGVYAVGAYLLFVVYYDLPLDHTAKDVARQPHATPLAMADSRGPGRTLYVDRAEETLYVTVKDTQMTSDASRSGVLSYAIGPQRETAFFPLKAPCITMIVDEAEGVLYSCEFFSRKLLVFDLATLRPTGREKELAPSMRPEGLVKLDDRHALVRFEIPGDAPDLLRLDTETLEIHPIDLPDRRFVVGCYALAVDRGRRKIWVPQLGNDVIVLNRLDWEGRVEDSVEFPGLSFEAVYSPHNDAIFVATLNRRVLYRVDPETLEVSEAPFPNGIRALRETQDGLLVAGDYIRGRIYLYDPDAEAILHTLQVGRKPQAIAIAPGSGNLYVHSSFGITRFELARMDDEAP